MQQFITDRLPEIEDLCRKHHVRRLSIFGSAVRDDFNPATSDVDVRVEFLPEADEEYLKNLGDKYAGLYNKSGRGIPDISAQGQHYATIWNGTLVPLDGTSAATPCSSAILAPIHLLILGFRKSSAVNATESKYSSMRPLSNVPYTRGPIR